MYKLQVNIEAHVHGHISCIFVALSKWEWRDADVLLRKKSRKIATQSGPSIYKAHRTSDLQERVLGQNSRALCLQRYKWGWVLRRDDEKYFQKASRQCLGTFNLTTFEYLWVSYDIRPCKLTRQNNTKYIMLTHVYEAWSKWSPEVHISAVSLPSSCNQLTLKGTCTARIKLTRSCPPFTTTKPSNLKMIQIHRTY